MVTTAGFNALLKLVEEPPPHLKFIFATRTHHYSFRGTDAVGAETCVRCRTFTCMGRPDGRIDGRECDVTDGDAQAAARFEQAYRDTYAAVTGYVMRRATSPADAADAIAETYLTLWRRLDDLPERADLRLWLYGVARRVMANQRRSVRRSSALTDRLAAELAALPKRFIEESPADLAHIARAYGRLSRADQELLALLAWEGLSREEIAATLGVSRPVIRLRLHRARQRMAHELANDQTDDMQRGYSAAPLEQGKAWS